MYSENRNRFLLSIKHYLLLGLTTLIIVIVILYSYLLPEYPKEPLSYQQIVSNKHDQLNNVYFVFLKGLGCFSDDSIDRNMGFEKIRSALTVLGFSFCDDRYLLYSYAGGKVENGKWHPEKYTAQHTGQPLYLSVERLEHLFENFSLDHPEAQFILVGHSLGGRIALDFVSTTMPQNKQKIIGVITLNSPLMGAGRNVPNIILKILSCWNAIYGSSVIKELIGESQYQQELADLRRQTIKQLQKDGVRVATFSTYQDYFVNPFAGCIMDENHFPVSEGFIVNLGNPYFKDIIGHKAILENPEIIRYVLSLCLN